MAAARGLRYGAYLRGGSVRAALLVALSGCLTHVPPSAVGPDRHLDVGWAPDFEAARARATAEDRPILLVLVAGELDGLC